MILGVWYCLWPLVHQLQHWVPRYGSFDVVLSIAAAVVGLLLLLRAKNKIAATLCCSSGGLLCLLSLRAIVC